MKKILLLPLILLFSLLTVKAQTIPRELQAGTPDKYCGTGLIVGDTIDYEDPKEALGGSAVFHFDRISDRLRLYVDQNSTDFTDDYRVYVQMKVEYEPEDGSGTVTDNITLMLEYFKDSVLYKDIAVYEFDNALEFTVILTSILDKEGNPISNLPDNACLELSSHTIAYKISDWWEDFTNAASISLSYDAVARVIDVTWTGLDGADYYDLEWTWIDKYDKNQNELNFNFKNNSTRIQTATPSYQITSTFDEAWLLVRVRGGYIREVGNKEIVRHGGWSSIEQGTVDAFVPVGAKISLNAFEGDETNWQYSSVYAEEGKKKETLAFFDGSLRNRQSQTRITSQGETVVGETVYDRYGRPAVSVVPVPIDSFPLQFYSGFNRDISGNELEIEDFNYDTTICGYKIESSPLDTSFGAANYYSSWSGSRSEIDAFIPEANGYVFIQKEFTKDLTGRTSKVGGLGSTFVIGSGHETEMEYGIPLEGELERLFGNNVGPNYHFQKEVVTDPNGQVTITYKDKEGKVIATALAGEVPSNMKSLPDTSSTLINGTILNYRSGYTDRGLNLKDVHTLEFSFPHVVTDDGDHSFSNELVFGVFNDACIPSAICYNCVYRYEFDVLDECGKSVLTAGAYIDTIGSIDTICTNDTTWYFFTGTGVDNSEISIALEKGSYKIVRRLKVLEDAIDFYRARYSSDFTCLKTYEDFFLEEMQDADTSGCYQGCAECYAQVEKLEQMMLAGDTLITQDLINSTDSFCNSLCSGTIPYCETMYGALLMDVSPGGQYALYSTDTVNGVEYYSSQYPLSLLNTGNSLPINDADWRHPAVPYVDEYGMVDSVLNPSGEMVRPEELGLVDEFIKAWKPSWAKSLVTYHPEYCYYEFCISNEYSIQFDNNMRKEGSYDSAVFKGYLSNPLVNDSFFTHGDGNGYLVSFQYNIDNYITFSEVINDESIIVKLTMLEYATLLSRCPEEMTNILKIKGCLAKHNFGTGGSYSHNRDWHVFRSLYLSMKDQYFDSARAEYAVENKCFNPCIGNSNYDSEYYCDGEFEWKGNLTGEFDCEDDEQTCSENFAHLYYTKTQRFHTPHTVGPIALHDPDIVETIVNTVNDSMDVQCSTGCAEQADIWMVKLVGCDLNATDSLNIRQALINVCITGCDFERPYGSSSLPEGTLSSDGYKSFGHVLRDILGEDYESIFCSDLNIDFPLTYGSGSYKAMGSKSSSGMGIVGGSGASVNECDCEDFVNADNENEEINYVSGLQVTGLEFFLNALASNGHLVSFNEFILDTVAIYDTIINNYDLRFREPTEICMEDPQSIFLDGEITYRSTYDDVKLSVTMMTIEKCPYIGLFSVTSAIIDWNNITGFGKIFFKELSGNSFYIYAYLPGGDSLLLKGMSPWILTRKCFEYVPDSALLDKYGSLSNVTAMYLRCKKNQCMKEQSQIQLEEATKVANLIEFLLTEEVIHHLDSMDHCPIKAYDLGYNYPLINDMVIAGRSATPDTCDCEVEGHAADDYWDLNRSDLIHMGMIGRRCDSVGDPAPSFPKIDNCWFALHYLNSEDSVDVGDILVDNITEILWVIPISGLESDNTNQAFLDSVETFRKRVRHNEDEDVDIPQFIIRVKLVDGLEIDLLLVSTCIPTQSPCDIPISCSCEEGPVRTYGKIDCDIDNDLVEEMLYLLDEMARQDMIGSGNGGSLLEFAPFASSSYFKEYTGESSSHLWTFHSNDSATLNIYGYDTCQISVLNFDPLLSFSDIDSISMLLLDTPATTGSKYGFWLVAYVAETAYQMKGYSSCYPLAVCVMTNNEVLGCGNTCKDCDEFRNLHHLFTTRFPDLFPGHPNYSSLLTSFMNKEFGFHLSPDDYLDFLDSCNVFTYQRVPLPKCDLALSFTGSYTDSIVNAIDILEQYDSNTGGLVDYYKRGKELCVTLVNLPRQIERELVQTMKNRYYSPSQVTLDVYATHSDFISLQIDTGSQPFNSTLITEVDNFIIYMENLTGKDPGEYWTTDTITAYDSTFYRREMHITLEGWDIEEKDNFINKLDSFMAANPRITRVYWVAMDPDIFYAPSPCCGAETALLCNKPFTVEIEPDTNECKEILIATAENNAQMRYSRYLDSLETDFKQRYITHCIDGIISEKLSMEFRNSVYHHTLYYYDQANNLVQTIPPSGVRPLDLTQAELDSIRAYRNDSISYFVSPRHVLPSKYKHTSLNSIYSQNTPDGAESEFWYDRNGRMILSQNAKQKVDSLYSYTLYDAIGRITEVGQLKPGNFVNFSGILDTSRFVIYTWFETQVTGASRKQITKTYYDVAFNQAVSDSFGIEGQQNLRGRVSSTTYQTHTGPNYDFATHYSYDIHGNVNHLIQELPELENTLQSFKHIKYYYDLISGNVKLVCYQPGEPDQFFHKYRYDEDNRIISVETSNDSIIWDTDAKYKYYRHGPLARIDLGDNKVQGVDYAYTLQGWLKGINSTTLDPTRDPGRDGDTNTVARDAFGFSLGYFDGDYTALGGNNSFLTDLNGVTNAGTNKVDLFNGNISSMVTALKPLSDQHGTATQFFRYDQLNRLISSVHTYNINMVTNVWNNSAAISGEHATSYSYDANGNILTLNRRGIDSMGLQMDSLTYHYYPGTNRLKYVQDAIPTARYAEDIDDQTDSNYVYDPIGNLVYDRAEDIDTIIWSVYGKVLEVRRKENSNKADLEFKYDAGGNRTVKIVKAGNPYQWKYTYYLRDAQGNVMATYNRTISDSIVIEPEEYDWMVDSLQGRVGTDSLALFMKNYYTAGAALEALKDHLVGAGLLDEVVRQEDRSYYENITGYKAAAMDYVDASDLVTVIADNDRNYFSFLMLYTAHSCANPPPPGQSFYYYVLSVNCFELIDKLHTVNAATVNAIYTNLTGMPPPPYPQVVNDICNGYTAAQVHNSMQMVAPNAEASTAAMMIDLTLFKNTLSNNYNALCLKTTLINNNGEITLYNILMNDGPSLLNTAFTNMADITLYNLLIGYDPAKFVEDGIKESYTGAADMWTATEPQGINILQKIKEFFGNATYQWMYNMFDPEIFTERVALGEQYIYGSSRLGERKADSTMYEIQFNGSYNSDGTSNQDVVNYEITAGLDSDYFNRTLGKKSYELTNHLGNVLAVVSDMKIPADRNGLSFDGDDFIWVGYDIADIRITGDMTIEMWLQPNDVSVRQNPFHIAYGGEGTITQEIGGALTFYYGTAGANSTPFQNFWTSGTIPVDEWTHVAIVRDFTNQKLHWYINGKLNRTAATTFDSATASTQPLYIGKGYTNNYRGKIDEIRIWNRARTGEEISKDLEKSLSGNELGLKGNWTFNEGEGQTAYDLASGYNGRLGNSGGTDAADPTWGTGEFYYLADVRSAQEYYPFGMMMVARQYIRENVESYRYAFNGMERDDEVSGAGNSYTAEYWQYDARLGRRWNLDPVVKHQESPYATFANNPVWFIDPNGNDTLRYLGDVKECAKILANIGVQFDAKLEYSYIRNEEGAVTGVNIFGVGGARKNDKNFDELRSHLETILNEGTDVLPIEKVLHDPSEISPVQWRGGMRLTDEGGRLRIEITEQYFTDDWSNYPQPGYRYLLREGRGGVDNIAYNLSWGDWKKGYAAWRIRKIPFNEALAHELLHYSRYLQGDLIRNTRIEENETIMIMNRWRSSRHIPKRGLKGSVMGEVPFYIDE